ncbi:MAG: hypothetical protein RL095_2436 [Verrucomicrobiota bacterium]|jgi:AraC-like DNA-binding protein
MNHDILGPSQTPAYLRVLKGLDLEIVRFSYQVIGPADWNYDGDHLTDSRHHIHFPISVEDEVLIGHPGERLSRIVPGRPFLAPSGALLHRQSRGLYENFYCVFTLESAPGADFLKDCRRIVFLDAFDPVRFKKLWHGAEMGCSSYWELSSFIQSQLARNLPDLAETVARQAVIYESLADILNYIDSHLDASLQIATLAEIKGMDRSAFTRHFKKLMGLSPKDYLEQELNRRAQDLILGTDLRMNEIADRLGFLDQYGFSRAFSKQNGMSPMRFRERFSFKRPSSLK